jgi:hypothetical protein
MESSCPLLSMTTPTVFQNCQRYQYPVDGLPTVFVTSYPKSGTTWMQCIVYHLLSYNKSRKIPFLDHISNYTPFYEAPSTWDENGNVAAKYMSTHASMGHHVFNTHIHHADLPKDDENIRYIYVLRNGKDACVSFFHHLSNQADEDQFLGTFDEFLQGFLQGTIVYGKWFHHIQHWLQQYRLYEQEIQAGKRTQNPILIVQYEKLLQDFPQELMKIIHFLELNISYEELTQHILSYMTFAYMKAEEKKFAPVSVPWKEGYHFIRKGQSGDHKITFTPEQINQFTSTMKEELKGATKDGKEEGDGGEEGGLPEWLLPWKSIIE